MNLTGQIELGGEIRIGPDFNDANGDGLGANQLVLIQDNRVRVLANNLFVSPNAGAAPARETSGFWVEPRDNGFEVMVRTMGRSRNGRVYPTEMSEFAVPRN